MFSKKLKLARKKLGLTQTELAKILNIATGTVGNWETGNRQPDIEMLKRLSEVLGVSTDYLLDITDSKIYPEDKELSEKIKELTKEEKKRVLDFVIFTKQQREGK